MSVNAKLPIIILKKMLMERWNEYKKAKKGKLPKTPLNFTAQ
jgi:hypothetical protein